MTPFEKIQAYSKAVCAQMRWKKAHPIITEEIENHLIDQRNAYIADGADEAAATDKAITQMGDPVTVGAQLDRTHRPKPQWGMLILTAVLLATGLFVRTFFVSSDEQLAPTVISIIVGLGLMTAAYFTDFTIIGKHPTRLYFALMALTVIAIIITPVINGGFYYADYLTLLFPLGFTAIVYATRNKGYRGIILCGFAYLLPAFLAYYIPSASSFLLLTLSSLVILCLAISVKWFNVKVLRGFLLVLTPVAIVLLLIVVLLYGSYQWERIQAMFDPLPYSSSYGYTAVQAKLFISGSSFIGHGIITDAAANLHWLSHSTDFLITYLIFNYGWVSFVVIMGLLLFFIVKGFVLCSRQKSRLALFVSVTVMMTFTIQVIGYVTANLGLQLLLPISLPLISYGNIAAMINLTLIGIMLSMFRTGDIIKDKDINPQSIKKRNYAL